MKDPLLLLNAAVMLGCASIYLGTGITLVFFSYPIAPKLTPQTYHLPLMEPIKRATRFFTVTTLLMYATAVVMLVDEWGDPYMWVPVVFLVALTIATGLTMLRLLPLNRRLDAGVDDNDELQSILRTWMSLNRVRSAMWAVEWVAVTVWFVGRLW